MSDVLDRVRAADPIDADEIAGMEVPPLESVLGTSQAPRRRRTSRRARLAMAGAIGAVAITVAISALPDQGGEPSSSASSGLLAAAAAARQQPAPPDAGFVYTRVEDVSLSTQATPPVFSLLLRKVEERWIDSEGGGRLLVTPKSPAFPSERDKERWIEAGRPLGDAAESDETLTASQLMRAVDPALRNVEQLPAEPDELERLVGDVAARSDVPRNVKSFELVAQLLAQPSLRPEVRAALFEVASRIPGIENLGATTDPRGRRGEAVAIRSDYSGARTRELLIFDPGTARVLASRIELLDPVTFTGGNTISERVLVSEGRTESTSERP